MFNTKSKKEDPVIISPSFQLPIILIVLQLGKEIRTFPFRNWISWKFFFPIIPGIFYFREKSSPHLLPILFNPKQLKDELLKKVDSLEIKNS